MRRIRISIATTVLILICIGIVMIYSSSGIYAAQHLGESTYFLKRHLLFLSFGFILTFTVMAIDYRILKKYAKPLIILSILMLCVVLIPWVGKASFGARRWFSLGPISFQPAEFTKIAMLIYVSDYLSRKQNRLKNFKEGFLPLIIIMGVVSFFDIKAT